MEVEGGDQHSSNCTGRRKQHGGGANEDEQPRRCGTSLLPNVQGRRRRRWKPLDRVLHFTNLLEEDGNRSSGTASSDKDNSPLSQKGLLTNDRGRTATATPTPTLTTTATSRTKTTSLEVETARRGSSSHGLIRRTGRRRYDRINIRTSSTGSWRHIEEDVGDFEDIRRWEV